MDSTFPLCFLPHFMFIRRVTKTDPHTGTTSFEHQLVMSYRTPNGPKQRTLLPLGKLDLEPKDLKRLAKRIEERPRGQNSVFPPSQQIEQLPSRAFVPLTEAATVCHKAPMKPPFLEQAHSGVAVLL